MERVTIKSYPSGLSLYISEDGTFEEVILEIGQKFQKSSSFFKDATLVLSLDGRNLSISEEHTVIKTIESNSNISICAIVGKDKDKELLFESKIQNLKSIVEFTRVDVKEDEVIWSSVLSGDSIESDMSIIVVGNVERGASVSSEKNIIVLGSMLGEVHAGVGNDSKHFLYASSMDPEKISLDKQELIVDKKLRKQLKKIPHIIFNHDNEITVKSI